MSSRPATERSPSAPVADRPESTAEDQAAASAFVNAALDRLRARSTRSIELHVEASKALPQIPVGTLNFSLPIYVDKASGARVVDVDGNEYIDLTMGSGPQILGHASPVVRTALSEALETGLQHALHSYSQVPLAHLINAAHPTNQQVLFCNSGTEATLHAIRLARAFTGKSKIAIFDGSYHGAHDYCMITTLPGGATAAPRFVPRGAGILPEALAATTVLPYWRDEALEAIHRLKDELAVVLVEPVQGSNPQTEQGPWLRALRQACTDAGVLLLFDEVITGFRLGYGGGQEHFAVDADLVTYGKIIGGGLPAGAITGRTEILHLLASRVPDPVVFAVGTFSGNPATMVAGTAVLDHLRANPGIYTHLARESERLAHELNHFFATAGLPAQVQAAQSILFLRLIPPSTAIRSVSDAAIAPHLATVYDGLQLRLLERGVLLPGRHQFHISAAHTEADVSYVIASFKEVFTEARQAGVL
jgi:glutamate-1-semialdehyde 2,1-aminomutase